MTAYGYNGETGEYTGLVNCQIDPVRSKLEGKDCYLLPADATLAKPPEFDPETQKAVWDGERWNVEEIPKHKIEIPPEPVDPPAPVPTEQETTDAMLVDHEYRITMLEMGL